MAGYPGAAEDDQQSNHLGSSQRPKQIDQSSIIKNANDESAFNNNLNIFPSGTNNTVTATQP